MAQTLSSFHKFTGLFFRQTQEQIQFITMGLAWSVSLVLANFQEESLEISLNRVILSLELHINCLFSLKLCLVAGFLFLLVFKFISVVEKCT